MARARPPRPGRGDHTAPQLQLTSPTDNATGIALNSNLVLTFNEAVKAGSGVINIYASNGMLFRSIDVKDSSQVTVASNTVTLNPGTDFDHRSRQGR